ncbi:MAG: hypothetical protein S4CHLAM20_08530 [Chlamydiia bacterium]|nr:hypothetical protein [Chlamydiia bacterium]
MVVKFKQESAFFTDAKRQKRRSNKKMSKVLKLVGGRKGLLLSSILLDKPKYKNPFFS